MPSTFAKGVPTLHITLTRSVAVVLYDWLMTTDETTVPSSHRAERQALRDLLSALIYQAGIEGVTQAEIDVARTEVSASMDE